MTDSDERMTDEEAREHYKQLIDEADALFIQTATTVEIDAAMVADDDEFTDDDIGDTVMRSRGGRREFGDRDDPDVAMAMVDIIYELTEKADEYESNPVLLMSLLARAMDSDGVSVGIAASEDLKDMIEDGDDGDGDGDGSSAGMFQ